MMVIQVNALGLAAYIQMKGGPAVKVVNKVFTSNLTSPRRTGVWSTRGSDCSVTTHSSANCATPPATTPVSLNRSYTMSPLRDLIYALS
jgi:hypothetical protein